MELLTFLLGRKRKETPKTIADYQREELIQQGKEQFQKLIEKGLGITQVALSK